MKNTPFQIILSSPEIAIMINGEPFTLYDTTKARSALLEAAGHAGNVVAGLCLEEETNVLKTSLVACFGDEQAERILEKHGDSSASIALICHGAQSALMKESNDTMRAISIAAGKDPDAEVKQQVEMFDKAMASFGPAVMGQVREGMEKKD